jgi:hypothetical protein
MTARKRLSEEDANALGFSVDPDNHSWYQTCRQRRVPYVIIDYWKDSEKWASVHGNDDTTIDYGLSGTGAATRWRGHCDELKQLMDLAADRAFDAGYPDSDRYGDSIDHGLGWMSACLAEDAPAVPQTLVQAWHDDTEGLDRLIEQWQQEAVGRKPVRRRRRRSMSDEVRSLQDLYSSPCPGCRPRRWRGANRWMAATSWSSSTRHR